MAFLRATTGLNVGEVNELKPGSLIIGRNPKRCDVVLDHTAVSREHACIEFVDGLAYVEDLYSRNGVTVNGRLLQPGPAGRMRLFPRDRVKIASYEFIYEEDPTAAIYVAKHDSTRPEILSTVNIASDSSLLDTNESDHGKLRTILAIMEELSSGLDLDSVLPKIIDSLFRVFRYAETGLILLQDEESGDLEPAVFRSRSGADTQARISRTLIGQVLESQAAILSGDAMRDERFDASMSVRGMRIRSVMCAPLMDGERRVQGIIQLESTGTEHFANQDLELLAGVARHLAIFIENSRLHETAMKAQRAQLEQRFQGLIEGSIQGILIHRHFRPLFVNDAWARLHDYTVDEIMQMQTVLPLVAPDERERAVGYEELPADSEKTSARYEARGLKKDGSEIWLEKFVTTVPWGGGPAVQTAIVDVSDRKEAERALRAARDELEKRVQIRTSELARANELLEIEIEDRQKTEEELRESEALYHSLVNHIPLCMARKNLDGTFTFVNRALGELLGREPEHLVGFTDFELFTEEQAKKCRQDDAEVARTGTLLEKTETFTLADGTTLDIHVLRTPTYDAIGRIIGTQLTFWDVTSQRQTEDERDRYARELERSNQDLEQFAYSVSHDLQSPLRTVASYCQLLQKRYAGTFDDEADEFLTGAIDGARRMRRLLDDLLSYSRVTTRAHQFMPANANTVLKEALFNLQAAIDESQAEVTQDELPSVVCDATQLMQLFQNLIGNAIRYRSEAPPRIHIRYEERSGCWAFHVRDNGVGIEPRHQARIFQIFQRLYAEHEIPGSGIGLSICKRIVERHGGRIWVESQAGQGSTFSFTLSKTPE
jgi:PAS domain S-box-containing protein